MLAAGTKELTDSRFAFRSVLHRNGIQLLGAGKRMQLSPIHFRIHKVIRKTRVELLKFSHCH